MTAPVEPDVENTPAHRERLLHDPVRREQVLRWLIPGLLLLVAVLNVFLHVRTYTMVSPVDELQHIDYLFRSPAVVAPGDTVGDDAMREQACRGIDAPGFPVPACTVDGDYRPRDFQENGYNTASINTPVYYTITHAIAWVVQKVTGMESLVTAGRLVGALWLGAGLVVAYFAGLRLGAPRWALAAVLSAVACVPAVVYPSSTITPDAATFLAGALVLWTGLWWEDNPLRRWPWLAAVTAFVVLLKMTNILAPLALGLYIVFRLVASYRRGSGASPADRRGWWVGGSTIAATAAVALVGWSVIQAARAHGDPSDVPMNARFAVQAMAVDPIFASLGLWITPISAAWVPVGDETLSTLLLRFPPLLMTAGFLATALFGVGMGRARTLAWGYLIPAVVGAPAFIVLSFVAQSVYVPPPLRYGYVLAPAMVIFAALHLRAAAWQWTVGGAAAVAVLLSAVRLT